MRFIPGPDLPTGGKIVGLDGVRDAYETGRGSVRVRARWSVEKLARGQYAVIHLDDDDAIRERVLRVRR